jgi:hypothetical protein
MHGWLYLPGSTSLLMQVRLDSSHDVQEMT